MTNSDCGYGRTLQVQMAGGRASWTGIWKEFSRIVAHLPSFFFATVAQTVAPKISLFRFQNRWPTIFQKMVQAFQKPLCNFCQKILATIPIKKHCWSSGHGETVAQGLRQRGCNAHPWALAFLADGFLPHWPTRPAAVDPGSRSRKRWPSEANLTPPCPAAEHCGTQPLSCRVQCRCTLGWNWAHSCKRTNDTCLIFVFWGVQVKKGVADASLIANPDASTQTQSILILLILLLLILIYWLIIIIIIINNVNKQ